ncbi:ammonium transmembrane transporter [Aureococcus anophagefferens]|nr:ammonium transmembrane transporter [Aureococcus anophagefferens]
MTGGIAAIVATKFMGARKGFPDNLPEGQPVYQALGIFILWMGWYGFNCCSTLYIDGYAQSAAHVAVTTTLGAAAGCLSTSLIGYIRFHYIDPGYVYNGKAGIDDAVDAFAVHGACGMWGVVAAALFATPYYYTVSYYSERKDDCAGVFYGGKASGSLVAAFACIGVIVAWVGSTMTLLFGTLSAMGQLRVTAEAAKADESLAGALDGEAALPSVGRRWLRFAVVAASSFLLNADEQRHHHRVMPKIAEDLDASLSSVLWVSLAHSLVTCALNSGAGLLGDVVGHRRLWYAGMAVRAAAQLCSGLAPSLPALVACRAAAGVGGAMDGPSGIALVLRAFPPERKPFLVALCTAVGTSAQSAGMILGAVVAQRFGWRMCFLAPVPLLAVIVLAAPVALRDDDGGGGGGGDVSGQLRDFDWGGTALLAAALIMYLLAINAHAGAARLVFGASAQRRRALFAGAALPRPLAASPTRRSSPSSSGFASRRLADLLLGAIQLFQGAGNGIASNTLIVFVTAAMPGDRIGNALGIVKTAQSVALMSGYSSTTAIVDGGGAESYATAAYAALAVATAFSSSRAARAARRAEERPPRRRRTPAESPRRRRR